MQHKKLLRRIPKQQTIPQNPEQIPLPRGIPAGNLPEKLLPLRKTLRRIPIRRRRTDAHKLTRTIGNQLHPALRLRLHNPIQRRDAKDLIEGTFLHDAVIRETGEQIFFEGNNRPAVQHLIQHPLDLGLHMVIILLIESGCTVVHPENTGKSNRPEKFDEVRRKRGDFDLRQTGLIMIENLRAQLAQPQTFVRQGKGIFNNGDLCGEGTRVGREIRIRILRFE